MSRQSATILIVDDDEDILKAGRLLLKRHFAEVITCNSPEAVPSLLQAHAVDAVLLDMNFGPGESSGRQGLDWLQRILDTDATMAVVMITAHGSVNTVIEAMKLGATDFVLKPWHNEKVVATVSAAVALHRSRKEAHSLRQSNQVLAEVAASGRDDIVGNSPALQRVLSIVSRTAPTDANVLILGENGTGKELIARELHRQSQRRSNVFLSVDLGSVTETLFESELFGHTKGAFTGAVDSRPGRFQAANDGTLFLDEIGNLPLHLQAKLLRALEERRVTPLGSDKAEAVDVRLVSATNVPMAELQDAQRFRPDLLFRLNTVEIVVPPLRERREDIMPLATYFAELFARKYDGRIRQFSSECRAALAAHHWPGNVRELRHTIERAFILSSSETLGPDDLQLSSQSGDTAASANSLNLEQVEKETIRRALHKHGFNISRAASELGLTRTSLYRRMEKYDF